MEEFNIASKRTAKLASLKRLLESGLGSIPELQPYIDNINSISIDGRNLETMLNIRKYKMFNS